MKVTGFKKILTVTTMITVGSFNSLMMTSGLAQTSPKLSGELNIRGNVTLNGVNAVNGTTILNQGNIKTNNSSFAMINLGKLGQVELSSDSEFVLNVENNVVGGNLRVGRAIFSVPAGVSVNVSTSEGLAATDGKEAAVVTIEVACGKTQVSSSKSNVKVASGERVEIVAAGQEVSVGTQNSQAPNCRRLAIVPASAGLSSGALAALLLAGIGGAIVGIIAVTQADDVTTTSVNISGFRP